MSELPASWTGKLVGGVYRVRGLIGQGGMGAVYEAMQEPLGRRVALKLLHPALALNPDLVTRFRREAEAAAALGHPNIVQVTDFGSAGDTPFLVMEYVQGASLARVIETEGPLPAPRAAFVATQVLSALSAAHAAGIVHRDLKPDNVILTAISGVGDIAKLLDFGIAKLAGDGPSSRLTATGAVMGTPLYMAPEQARGRPVDARTDVYAMGVVLYEALSGKLPFSAENYNALLFAILEDAPPSLGAICPRLDPGLTAIVERAMARDPAARFQSAEEFRAALEPFSAATFGASPWRATPAPSDTRPEIGTDPTLAAAASAPDAHRARATMTPAVAVTPSGPPPRTSPEARTGRRLGIAALAAGAVVAGALVFGGSRIGQTGRSPSNSSSELPTRGAPGSSARAGQPASPSSAVPTGTPPEAVLAPPIPEVPAVPTTPDAPAVPNAATHGPRRRATGGVHPRVRGATTRGLYEYAHIQAIVDRVPALRQCFVQSEYAPQDHQSTEWDLRISPTGRVLTAEMTAPRAAIPTFTPCVVRALRRVEFGPPAVPAPDVINVTIRSRVGEVD